jgi:hypothetical protein
MKSKLHCVRKTIMQTKKTGKVYKYTDKVGEAEPLQKEVF